MAIAVKVAVGIALTVLIRKQELIKNNGATYFGKNYRQSLIFIQIGRAFRLIFFCFLLFAKTKKGYRYNP